MKNINRFFFLKGLRDGIPIFLGYLAVSFTFGIAAKNSGLTPITATIMSVLNLTSAGQFASLDLISTHAPYIELIATQVVINLRYSLMSASLSQKASPSVTIPQRLLMSYGITDEIFGVASSVHGKLKPSYMYGLILISALGWSLGTLFGVLLGSVMSPRLISAFSVALYGMFVALIFPAARTSKIILTIILISMTASSVFAAIPVTAQIGSGFKIIILTVAVSAGAALLCPIREGEDTDA